MGPVRTAVQRAAAVPYSGNQSALRRLSRTANCVQAKLTVGAVNDPLEAEADRVAAGVMRMPDPGQSAAPVTSGPPKVQRKCAACEEEAGSVQRQAAGAGATAATGQAPPSVHQVLNSPGQPLDSGARAFMEPRFGRDFSSVKVHTGGEAADSAKSIGALAYTHGQNIVFDSGRYSPQSEAGRYLLAHELAHVAQQSPGAEKVQKYDESTEPNTKLGQFAKGVSLLAPPFLIAAGVCLSKLEQPMIDLTFQRWMPDACGRRPDHLLHSREWDAFGHCWIGCEGSRKCGTAITAMSGTVREFYREAQRILKTRPHDSFKQDTANQAVGRNLAYTAGTCYSLCDKAWLTGGLDLSAPVADCVSCAGGTLTETPCPGAATPAAAAPAATPPASPPGGQAAPAGGQGQAAAAKPEPAPTAAPGPQDAGAPKVGAYDSENS
jgi:hypothetical protein